VSEKSRLPPQDADVGGVARRVLACRDLRPSFRVPSLHAILGISAAILIIALAAFTMNVDERGSDAN
jgi:hypothetical protein